MNKFIAIFTLVMTITVLATLHYYMKILGMDFVLGIITAVVIMQAGYYAKNGKLIDY